jgi:hypothetical protein
VQYSTCHYDLTHSFWFSSYLCMQTIEAFFPPPETPRDTASCSYVCPVEFFLTIPTRSGVTGWCQQETFTRIPTVSERNDTILYTLMGLFQVA